MKTEELMVGDWVSIIEPDDFHGYIGKVIITNAETNYIMVHIPDMHLHDVFVEDLQPIELTEEILEKNGFTSSEDQYDHKKYFILGKNEYGCDIYWDGSTILFVEENYEPTTYAYICDVKYVHELQHALKLYGIKKEIEL